MNNSFCLRSLLFIKSNNKLVKKFFSTNSSTQLSHEISLSKCRTTEDQSVMTSMRPLIGSEEIRERQQNVMKLIDKCSYHRFKSSLLLISGSSRQFQADTKIPNINYKQNSDFTYLTGFTNNQSNDCVLALIGGNGEPLKSILFAPFNELSHQLWEGPDIREHSLWINSICDDLKDLSQLDDFIGSLNGSRQVFVSKSSLNVNNSVNNNNNNNSNESFERLTGHLSKLLNLSSKSVIHPVSQFIDQLRIIKSKSECDAMRRVCRIGSQAMLNTMSWTKSMVENNLINESQIAAKFEFETRINGARKLSFPTVCGSGHRSTIIHYGCNNQFASKDDWVLTDGGCEDIDGYNSDITRTWPLNGNFANDRLRHDLYEAVCEVQKDLISALSADPLMTLDLLFRLMCNLLAKVLIDFKVLNITVSAQEAATLAYKFCPHHVSHYLGIEINFN